MRAAERLPLLSATCVALLLVGCGTAPRAPVGSIGTAARAPAPNGALSGSTAARAARSSGGYFQDDGPGEQPIPGPDQVPDAVPRIEPVHRGTLRPYVVLGRQYVPISGITEFRERGIASWYGRQFHGRQTSNGERYDMYAMTAAHPTLPIPSYVRVTQPATGRSVVVRVNDRGPFLGNRVIDLSLTAAHRLGIASAGTGEVEIELLAAPDGYSPALLAANGSTASSRPTASGGGQWSSIESIIDARLGRSLDEPGADPLAPLLTGR